MAILHWAAAPQTHRRFSKFVSDHDRDRWRRLFMNIMEQSDAEKRAFDIEISCADDSIFPARIDCQRRDVIDAPANACSAVLAVIAV